MQNINLTASPAPSSVPTYIVFSDKIETNLYGPERFTQLDWILSAIILGILIVLVLFCYICVKCRNKKEAVHSGFSMRSNLNAAEGKVTFHSRENSAARILSPKGHGSFRHTHQVQVTESLAFDAAVVGVGMTKSVPSNAAAVETQIAMGALPRGMLSITEDEAEVEVEIEYEYEDYEEEQEQVAAHGYSPLQVAQEEPDIEDEEEVILMPTKAAAKRRAPPPPAASSVKKAPKQPAKPEPIKVVKQPKKPEVVATPVVPLLPPPVPAAARAMDTEKETAPPEQIINIPEMDKLEDEPEENLEYLSIEDAKALKTANKEMRLSDDDFLTVFSMTKEEFGALKGWKQKGLRKAKGFF